jgi:hypothetical protein
MFESESIDVVRKSLQHHPRQGSGRTKHGAETTRRHRSVAARRAAELCRCTYRKRVQFWIGVVTKSLQETPLHSNVAQHCGAVPRHILKASSILDRFRDKVTATSPAAKQRIAVPRSCAAARLGGELKSGSFRDHVAASTPAPRSCVPRPIPKVNSTLD